MNNKSRIGYFLTILAGFCWGASGVFGQFLFMHKQMHTAFLVPIRLLLAGSILLIWDFFRYKGVCFQVFRSWRSVLKLFLFSVIGVSFSQFFYFLTIELSNAATATVLQYLFPVMIVFWVCIRSKRKPAKLELIALALSLCGVFLIATGGKVSSMHLKPVVIITGGLCALCVSIYILISDKIMEGISSNIILGWGMLFGGTILSVFMKPWKYSFQADAASFFSIGFIVLFGTIISYALYLYGVSKIGAVYASMLASVEPLSATLLSFFWQPANNTMIASMIDKILENFF